MADLYNADFQTATWNSTTFALKGSTPPESVLDDPTQTTDGSFGAAHGQVAGSRVKHGNATLVCAWDSALFALAMGMTAGVVTKSNLVLTYISNGVSIVLTMADMVLARRTPSEASVGGGEATITLEFQSHCPTGGAGPVATTT